MSGPATLSAAARVALRDLADALIPGGEGMPSAGEAGVDGTGIDRVIAVRPHAAPRFVELLEGIAADPGSGAAVERAERLRREDPEAFALIASFVVGAYFLDEGARASIGYPGQGPSDTTFEDETGYIAEGLLDPVMDRGPRAPGV